MEARQAAGCLLYTAHCADSRKNAPGCYALELHSLQQSPLHSDISGSPNVHWCAAAGLYSLCLCKPCTMLAKALAKLQPPASSLPVPDRSPGVPAGARSGPCRARSGCSGQSGATPAPLCTDSLPVLAPASSRCSVDGRATDRKHRMRLDRVNP